MCLQLASPPVLSKKIADLEFQFRRKKQNLGIELFHFETIILPFYLDCDNLLFPGNVIVNLTCYLAVLFKLQFHC